MTLKVTLGHRKPLFDRPHIAFY